jgi:hypothetical protein
LAEFNDFDMVFWNIRRHFFSDAEALFNSPLANLILSMERPEKSAEGLNISFSGARAITAM